MQVAASIFKAYDIRGIVPGHRQRGGRRGLGKAFGTIALAQGEKTVAVGRDGRLSGPSLSAALMRGLVAAGIEVIDVGMVTTPMLYFAANTLCTSGIQVTGSHNPKDYNGFKMVHGRARHLRRRDPGLAPHDGSRDLGAARRRQRAPGRCDCRPTASASSPTSSWRAR